MADTNHVAGAPVEGDGVSYRGIGWFLVVLIGTVLFCEVFVWGLFKATDRYRSPAAVRAPLAAAAAEPRIEGGRLLRGTEEAPGPGLLVVEPTVLKAFRDQEEQVLHTYGWVDQGTQTVRLTIDRAKELLLERGLPVREGAGPLTPDAPPSTTAAEPVAAGAH